MVSHNEVLEGGSAQASDTPLTDTAEIVYTDFNNEGMVDSTFARNLERRLAAVETERDEATRKAEENRRAAVSIFNDQTKLLHKFIAAEARVRELERALRDCCERMERARGLLQVDEHSNWGMLDTTSARAALADPPKGATE